MSEPDAVERQILTTTAIVLDQGVRLDNMSRGLSMASLIGVVCVGVVTGRASAPSMALLASAALAGLVELWLAMRVAIDAALFRQLATAATPDWATLDAALLRLHLLPKAKAGRPAAERIGGTWRLLRGQGAALIVQVGLIIAGAVCAALR